MNSEVKSQQQTEIQRLQKRGHASSFWITSLAPLGFCRSRCLPSLCRTLLHSSATHTWPLSPPLGAPWDTTVVCCLYNQAVHAVSSGSLIPSKQLWVGVSGWTWTWRMGGAQDLGIVGWFTHSAEKDLPKGHEKVMPPRPHTHTSHSQNGCALCGSEGSEVERGKWNARELGPAWAGQRFSNYVFLRNPKAEQRCSWSSENNLNLIFQITHFKQ